MHPNRLLLSWLFCAGILHCHPVLAAPALKPLGIQPVAFEPAEVVCDPVRRALWFTDPSTKRLVRIQLDAKWTTEEFAFDLAPESLSISPDSRRLYVGLVQVPHRGTTNLSPPPGALVEMDLADPNNRTRLELPVDPLALGATDRRRVVVAGITGLQNGLHTVDVAGGSVSPGLLIPPVGALVLHPTQKRVYTVPPMPIAGVLGRVDLDGATDAPTSFYSLVTPPFGNRLSLAIHPDGTRLVGSWGAIYQVAENPEEDLKKSEDSVSYIGRPAYDLFHKSIFGSGSVLDEGFMVPGLVRLNSGNGVLAGAYVAPSAAWVFPLQDVLVAVSLEAPGAVIRLYDNPASGAETNQPPVAVLKVTPARPRVGEVVKFDAGGSTDDEGGLTYAWNLGAAGAFGEAGPTSSWETTFDNHGTYLIDLRVQDRHGEISLAHQRIDVSATPEALSRTNFSFTVPATEFWDVAFHPSLPRAYVADDWYRRIFEVNLTTGFVEREFHTEHYPQHLAVTRDGRWLEIASITAPRGVLPSLKTILTEIDLETGSAGRTIEWGGYPEDLVAIDRKRVILAAGGLIATVDMAEGVVRGFREIPSPLRLALGPDRDELWVGEGRGAIHRVALHPETGEPTTDDAWYGFGSLIGPRAAFPVPGSDFCLTSEGGLFALAVSSGGAAVSFGQVLSPRVNDVWFGRPERALYFAATSEGIQAVNRQSHRTVSVLGGINASWLAGYAGHLFAVDAGTRTVWRLENPALGAEGNQAPTPSFTASQANPTTTMELQFDASATTDDRDPAPNLKYRWQVGGPVAFVGEQGSARQLAYRFFLPGRYSVALEVEDSLGATNGVARTFDVAEAPDPGTVAPQVVGDRVPFSVAKAVFDPIRPYLYLIDSAGGSVQRWNLAEGTLDRRWTLPGVATDLVVAPDGRRLYTSMSQGVGPAGSASPPGFLAVFDLDAQTKIRQFAIVPAPSKLAATDRGLVITTGLDFGVSALVVYDAATGARLGSAPITNPWALSLHPNQHTLYTADNNIGNQNFSRYELDPTTGGISLQVMSWTKNPPDLLTDGYVYALPTGDYILGGHGDLLLSSEILSQDLQRVRSLVEGTVSAASPGPLPGDLVVANQSTASVQFFTAPGYLSILSRPMPAVGWVRALSTSGKQVFLASDDGAGLQLTRWRFPAASAQENLPPSAVITAPANGQAISAFQPAVFLSADIGDEDGVVTNISFYVNGILALEGNGSTWVHPGLGTYELTCVARDNWGAATTSAPVVLRISQPPVVNVVRPAPGTVFESPASIEFEAEASDPDGTIDQVAYYNGTNILGIATVPPYRVVTGELTRDLGFRAVATDHTGLTTEVGSFMALLGLPGDEYARPFVLEGNNATARASNREATRQAGEPNLGLEFGTAGKSLWWRWVAPTNGTVTISTVGSSFDTVLGVFVVTNRTQRLLVASNDDGPLISTASYVKFWATNKGEYRIVVDGARSSSSGDVQLALKFEPAASSGVPPNDAFANRTVLQGSNGVVTADSTGASRENGEPQILTGALGGRSLWWDWRPPGAGLVTLSTAGSAIDTLLGVYRGAQNPASPSALQRFLANDDDPRGGSHSFLRFYARATDRFFITTDGYGGVGGAIRLTLDFEAQAGGMPPANDRFVDRTPIHAPNVPQLGSNVGVETDPLEPLAFARPVWWTWTAPATQPVVISTAGSSFDTVLGVYLGSTVGDLVLVARSSFGLKGVSFGAPQAEVGFVAVAGQSYQIAVGGELTDRTGGIMLTVIPGAPLSDVPLLSTGLDSQTRLGLSLGITGPHTAVILSSTNLTQWFAIRTNTFQSGQPLQLETFRKPMEFLRAVLWE